MHSTHCGSTTFQAKRSKQQQYKKTWLVCGRLAGVTVSVLATGPNGVGFKPGRGDQFLRAIKIGSTPSFRWEVKPEIPFRKILQHVKDPLRYYRYWYAKFSLLRPFLLLAQMSLLVGLPERSGGRVRSYPQPASSPWHCMLTYHPGDKQQVRWWPQFWDVSPHHNKSINW
jgi:hypothetical protein